METNVEFGQCEFQKKQVSADETLDTKDVSTRPKSLSGNLYFGEHDEKSKHIPFILTSNVHQVDEVISTLTEKFQASSPKIVLVMIANTVDSTITTENRRLLKNILIDELINALNTTEMWMVCDGLDHGFCRDFGSALESELCKKEAEGLNVESGSHPERALIGICRDKLLKFFDKLNPPDGTVPNDAVREEYGGIRDVDKHFNYYIFVKDRSNQNKDILKFVINFSNHMRKEFKTMRKTAFSMNDRRFPLRICETPVLGILFNGELTDIGTVLGYLENSLPVVIIEGSGGLADLIAFAYRLSTTCAEGTNIAEYTETVLKPQIMEEIHQYYPDFIEFAMSERQLCEDIVSCVRCSVREEQGLIKVLTLTDLKEGTKRLTAHLLEALFNLNVSDSDKAEFQMKEDLFLAMDWNCPNVAKSVIFEHDPIHKFKVDNETFYRALKQPKLDRFVHLFLSQGFVLRKFLRSSTLLDLFHNSLSQGFFRVVVWENLLSYSSPREILTHFVDINMNQLFEELTGIPDFFRTEDLDMSFEEGYCKYTPQEAEQKAIAVLSVWAIFSHRTNLVKHIWMYSEQPAYLALVCSVMLNRMKNYALDLNLKHEMEEESKEFSAMATKLMAKCYNEVPRRAIDLLQGKHFVWSFKPLLEIAVFAKDGQFLAQTCCQKYLDSLLMGKIKVRDLSFGDLTVPAWLKILLSNFFIFPMFFWISFEDIEDKWKKGIGRTRSSSSLERILPLTHSSSFEKMMTQELSVVQKLYHLYTAPISKFWVFHVFYIMFLFFLSIAAVFPACGSLYLDLIACVWIGIIITDYICRIARISRAYPSMSLKYKYAEVAFMSAILLCYVLSRLLRYHVLGAQYNTKVLLSVTVLYFYYRIIFIAFPISSEFGPLLYRIKHMILYDFFGFLRIISLIMISNGLVMHAIIFPDYELGRPLIQRATYDAAIAIFLAPSENFGTTFPTCILLERHPNKISFYGTPENVCKVGRYFSPECPNPGVWNYIFGMQYFVLLKLILLFLLLALFSNTFDRLYDEGIHCWKVQRFQLVTDFSYRFVFPPPLSPISYSIMLLRHLTGWDKENDRKSIYSDEHDFFYWKKLATEYFNEAENRNEFGERTDYRLETIRFLTIKFRKQGLTITEIMNRLEDFAMRIKQSQKYLMGKVLEVSLKDRLQAKNVPQVFSRISPYPNTNICRLPVSEGRVPWSRKWQTYDPIAYTMPTLDFPPEVRGHVDFDIQAKMEEEERDFQMPSYNWNATFIGPTGIINNRKSWIVDKDGSSVVYKLDLEGLPINPVGRTGLKGKGRLPRWGPNHYIYVIITRWRQEKQSSLHNYLEVVLAGSGGDASLPGGYIVEENAYQKIANLFVGTWAWQSETDMVAYFRSLASKDEDAARESAFASREYLDRDSEAMFFEKLKKGYLDEVTNTDQAWCEAEIWHFHYNVATTITDRFKGGLAWEVLNNDVLQKLSIGQASLVHTMAKRMKAALEIM